MVRVVLTNGQAVAIEGATQVAVQHGFIGKTSGLPAAVAALVCKSERGDTVAEFKLESIIGYAISDEGVPQSQTGELRSV